MLFILVVLVLLLTFLVLLLIFYARLNYGKLDGLGIPIIPPTFLLGSVPEVHKNIHHFEDYARLKKYGGIWGLYQGRTPIIYVADPELIRQIFVKDAPNHFYDREPFNFGNEILNQILDWLPGETWKTLRTAQAHLFVPGKIKLYCNESLQKSIECFMKSLDQMVLENSTKRLRIDTRELLYSYTIDSVCQSLLSTQMLLSENPEFYKGCKKLIGEGEAAVSSFYIWTLVFPFLTKFEPTFVLQPILTNTFREILRNRRTTGITFGDLADVMNQNLDKISTKEYQKLGITETTILAQILNVFFAGFDSISTIMTFLLYHLAKDPSKQAKLHDEIDNVIGKKFDGTINYESLSEMPYLNACISEATRLYPTFIRPERVCTKEWENKELGIKIPKGTVVMVPVWAANRHPDVYDQPDDFIPERWLGENKGKLNKYAFGTYGYGHKNCIGYRLANEAMRVGIAHLLRKYTIETVHDTRINYKPGLLLVFEYDPIYLELVQK